jgi:flagellar protein FliO/FliZ
MTWMIIRLILSLGFIAVVLLWASRLAKKKGLGQGNGLIEVVARQRMGRASTVNVVRIADVVLVIGATEEHITLLAEVDSEAVDTALAERRVPTPRPAPDVAAHSGVNAPAGVRAPSVVARPSSGVLAGSVFDRAGWGTFVRELRERTVRKP